MMQPVVRGALACALVFAACSRSASPPPPAAGDAAEQAQLTNLASTASAAAQQAAAAGVDGGAAVGAAVAMDPEALRGAATYQRLCALCHGPERKGYAADNAPSLVSMTFLQSASEAFLRDSIAYGRPGTAMAGFASEVGGPLSKDDMAALIRFLRHGAPDLVALPPPPPGGDAVNGQRIYDAECKSCHGDRQQRATAVHLPNTRLLSQASDGFLAYALAKGRPGTPMVAFEGRLDANQQRDVIAYVRSFETPLPPQPAQPLELPPAPPREGPIVLNEKGKHATFELKDGRLASLDAVNEQAFKLKRRIIFADARAPSDWMQLHIEGAVATPYYQLSSLDDLPNDGTWIIAYCACPHHASGVVVDELRKRGYKHTAVLDEGVFAWEKKGYPVVKGKHAPSEIAAPPPAGAVMPAPPGAHDHPHPPGAHDHPHPPGAHDHLHPPGAHDHPHPHPH